MGFYVYFIEFSGTVINTLTYLLLGLPRVPILWTAFFKEYAAYFVELTHAAALSCVIEKIGLSFYYKPDLLS